MEKTVNKKMWQHWLGRNTAGYDELRIRQVLPLPAGTTVMAVDMDDGNSVTMRECNEVARPYCLVLTEDDRGKTEIYPFDLSCDGGIDVRGSVIPIRRCKKCGGVMRPHMEEYELGSLYYTCACGSKVMGWTEMEEDKDHE